MPLHDLVHYFNQQHARLEATTPPLPVLEQTSDSRVVAHYAGLTLESVFQPVVDIETGRPVGREALLRARHARGTLLPPASVFMIPADASDVIYLDRLCRTLHALNFLLGSDDETQWLSVNIHPRHLTSVLDAHGQAYEGILQQLGLTPQRVHLEIDASAAAGIPHATSAIANYRSRGYRIILDGINPTAAGSAPIAALGADTLKLDFVRYPDARLPPATEAEPAAPGSWIALGSRPEQTASLHAAGIQLFQGFDFGLPL